MTPERVAQIQQAVVGNGWVDSHEWADMFHDLQPLLATWAEEDRAAGAAEVVARVEAVLSNPGHGMPGGWVWRKSIRAALRGPQ